MVNNELDTNGFVTTDAINYVTDKHGSVVDVNSVKRSADRISEKTPGRYVVTYRYGKASGKVAVTVRSDVNEGISKTVPSWARAAMLARPGSRMNWLLEATTMPRLARTLTPGLTSMARRRLN